MIERDIIDDIDNLFCKYGGIIAHACSAEDDFWQNNMDPKLYSVYGKSLVGVTLKDSPRFKGKEIIDVERNPGHSHIICEMWFGSISDDPAISIELETYCQYGGWGKANYLLFRY